MARAPAKMNKISKRKAKMGYFPATIKRGAGAEK